MPEVLEQPLRLRAFADAGRTNEDYPHDDSSLDPNARALGRLAAIAPMRAACLTLAAAQALLQQAR